MGYLATTGRGTLRTDATRARDLAPTAFRRRNFSGISRRQKIVGSSSRSTWMGRLFFSCSSCTPQRRKGKKGGRGESQAQKDGAVCADSLPKKRTARASGVFTGALTIVPIKRECPLRQSADLEKSTVRPLATQISNSMGGELPFSTPG